jgi:long-chain acyl-CoA synthetase
MIPHPRTQLNPDFAGLFLHEAVLRSAEDYGNNIALVDTSLPPSHLRHRISYAEYGSMVEDLARGFVREGLRPGEVVALFLTNSWEFCVAFHAATLAGLIPTLLNPHYREREVRYQLSDSDAVLLISDGPQLADINLGGLHSLRNVFTTRTPCASAEDFASLLHSSSSALPQLAAAPNQTLAALPYSSGTTGLPKGVMLTHENLVVNCRQFLAPGEEGTNRPDEIVLCFLPLYHIYGLNVVLNPALMMGNTVVLMPRWDLQRAAQVVVEEAVTWINVVPPVMNAICNAVVEGRFPRAGEHCLRGAKSGAAPLAPELPRRFTQLTGIRVRQGYGMTEASPVTHLGYLEAERYCPESIGQAAAATECRILREDGCECDPNEAGELVMRGAQFMHGYWKNPEATASVLRDGWYFSGDVATADQQGFFRIVDRRKELIKYKGLAIAPAEVESVLLEHPAVRDCGVVGRADDACGEVPVAFVVAQSPEHCERLHTELPRYVAERLSTFKQPREVRIVESIPRNPSGKILRKDLRAQL